MRPRFHLVLLGLGLLLTGGLTAVVASAQPAGGRGGGQPIVLDPAQLTYLKSLYVPPTSLPFPPDNPSTAPKLALGKRLFFDPALSGNGQIACATCHDARHGFADPRPLSIGVKGAALARRTPPVVNLAWATKLFWDGRARSLEEQAVMPIANDDEMGMPHNLMVAAIGRDRAYRSLFAQAFPGEAIGPATVGKALAVFERTLVTANTPFDRWVAGDNAAISEQAQRGFVEFNTRAGCAQCHAGWNFSDGSFNNIGIGDADLGRSLIAPGEEAHAFKTPSLRNVANRAPYMHTGGLADLPAVLRHYRRPAVARAELSSRMAAVRTGRGGDIIAFLQTLSAPADPELVRLQEALERRVQAQPTRVAAIR